MLKNYNIVFTIKIYIVKEKITVIIPTHNYRLKLVNRILDYYSNYPVNIIIEDGSIKKNQKKFKNKVNYYHSPKKQFVMRIKHALEHCKTKYVAINQDDDFLIYSSLIKAKKFLDKNKKYSFVSGHIFYFENFFNSIFYHTVYETNSLRSNSSQSSYKRLLNFCNHPQMLVASLFKRIDLLKNLNSYEKFIKKVPPKKRRLYDEFAFSLFMFSRFNYKFLNLLWQLRDRNVYPFEKKKNLKSLSRPTNKEILNVKSFEFKIFKKEIEKIFRLKKNNNLENLLIKCLKYYIKFEQLDSKSSSMKKSIKLYLPKFTKTLSYIKKVIRVFFFERYNNLNSKDFILNKINKNEYTKFLYVLKKYKLSVNKLTNN